MPVYRILYNGYGANNALYREQEIELKLRHDWSRNNDEAANVMYLVHEKLKEHFSRYEILQVEKVH
jgi:predicted ATPase